MDVLSHWDPVFHRFYKWISFHYVPSFALKEFASFAICFQYVDSFGREQIGMQDGHDVMDDLWGIEAGKQNHKVPSCSVTWK
jgi:hypothetical protein